MGTNTTARQSQRTARCRLILALALLATPGAHCLAEATPGDLAGVDPLRRQWLEERAALDSKLRVLERAMEQQRVATREQQAALAAANRRHAELSAGLRGDLASARQANAIAWSLGGLAMLLLGGAAVAATRRFVRARAGDLQAQLDALDRRHASELKVLRAQLQHLQGELSRVRAPAPRAAPRGARPAEAQAATAAGHPQILDRHPPLVTRVADGQPASPPEPAAGSFSADQRVVIQAPLVTLAAASAAAPTAVAPPAAALRAEQLQDAELPGELDLLYDPSSLVIVEEHGTTPEEADAQWQSLTAAPLSNAGSAPAAPVLPGAALRGNLTMETPAGSFPPAGNVAAHRQGTTAHEPFTDQAGDDTDLPHLDLLHLDPAHLALPPEGPPGPPGQDAALPVAGSSRQAELRSRLAALDLSDDLRRRLNAQPELLRALVEEALGVVLVPTPARSIEDWRLLVLDAWRRDNMQEALARTDSMLAAATSDTDRARAELQREKVLARIARSGLTTAEPDPAADAAGARPAAVVAAPAPTPARAPAALLDEAVRLRREARDPATARTLLTELVGQLHPAEDAAQAHLWMRALINLALVEAAPGGDATRAIALYDRIEQSLQGIPDAALSSNQATSAAQALFNRAVLHYEHRGDAESAIADYRHLVARFGSRREADVLRTVAHALSNQAWLLANVQDDASAAIALYQTLDLRFGDQRDREIALLAASALFAAALLAAREPGSTTMALDFYRRIVNRHELTADPAFVTLVARSLFNLGALLGARQETHAQAIDAYDALVERCAGSADPQLADWAAGGLVNSAALLLRAGDVGAARANYTRTVEVFRSARSEGAAEQVARALFNLGGIASQQGDITAAIRAYDELQQHAPEHDRVRHELVIARGLANLAHLHATARNDTALALQTFTQLLARFRDREEAELAEQGARALLGIGVLNATRRQDYAAAAAAYDELATRYGHRREPQIAIAVAKGLFNLAALQARQLHDLKATLVTLNRLVERFAGYQEPEVEVRVVSGLLTRARVQERLSELAAARAGCEELVGRYGSHPDPRVQRYVEAARRMLGTKAAPGTAAEAARAEHAQPDPRGDAAAGALRTEPHEDILPS